MEWYEFEQHLMSMLLGRNPAKALDVIERFVQELHGAVPDQESVSKRAFAARRIHDVLDTHPECLLATQPGVQDKNEAEWNLVRLGRAGADAGLTSDPSTAQHTAYRALQVLDRIPMAKESGLEKVLTNVAADDTLSAQCTPPALVLPEAFQQWLRRTWPGKVLLISDVLRIRGLACGALDAEDHLRVADINLKGALEILTGSGSGGDAPGTSSVGEIPIGSVIEQRLDLLKSLAFISLKRAANALKTRRQADAETHIRKSASWWILVREECQREGVSSEFEEGTNLQEALFALLEEASPGRTKAITQFFTELVWEGEFVKEGMTFVQILCERGEWDRVFEALESGVKGGTLSPRVFELLLRVLATVSWEETCNVTERLLDDLAKSDARLLDKYCAVWLKVYSESSYRGGPFSGSRGQAVEKLFRTVLDVLVKHGRSFASGKTIRAIRVLGGLLSTDTPECATLLQEIIRAADRLDRSREVDSDDTNG